MKFVISRYNHDMTPILPYIGTDYVLYDRSEMPYSSKALVVRNVGSDIYDKLDWIIENYDNLPDVVCLIKANLFKYITEEEFKKVKDNKTFTPLLTQHHKTYLPVCWYENGLYCEVNNYWYLNSHPAKHLDEINEAFRMDQRLHNAFAPGSNYIVPRENILKHSKEFYIKLRSFLEWGVYPGDAQLLERNLFYLWR